MPKPPDLPTGPHCTDPVTCEFFDRCNPPLPDDHIGYLPRLHASAEEALEQLGVESIRDVPDDFELTEIQRRAATCVQTGEPWFSPELGKAVESLRYPLYFADFESVNPAVPRFPGMRPYDQLPFQWSVHVLRQPGAEHEHYEFLATDGTVILRVSDDGVGFDPGALRNQTGLGMISMDERMRFVGGTLSVMSRPSMGTQVEAAIPLSRNVVAVNRTSESVSPDGKTALSE